ncbi:MAG: hypothetical protein IPK78_13690 [Rhodospirillales bacterium]|nr:hypothetical protein [Rhodospirillales bacterium]
MTDATRLTIDQAEALVAEKRRMPGSDGVQQQPERAKALLDLTLAYEGADRTADALASAKQGVAVFESNFLAKPTQSAGPMRGLLSQYLSLPSAAGRSRMTRF